MDRALQLLEAVAAHGDGARLSDLARQVGLAPSTAHRLLLTLESRGFARFDAQHSHWHVGRRAFAVGMAFSHWQHLISEAMPFLRHLRDATRETANLGVLEEGEVLTLAQAESREVIRAIAPPGGRAPVLNSGMGKAILATWPDAAITALARRHPPRPMTTRSLRTLTQIRAEIDRTRQQGHAVDDEEFASGMRCVAAVIWSPSGEAVAAISVSALAARMPPAAVEAAGALVREQAARLSAALGGQAPAGNCSP